MLAPVPWVAGALSRLPGSPFNRFIEWCTFLTDERRKVSLSLALSFWWLGCACENLLILTAGRSGWPGSGCDVESDRRLQQKRRQGKRDAISEWRFETNCPCWHVSDKKYDQRWYPANTENFSETTAGTLTFLFYFLAAHPSKQNLLRAELSSLPKSSAEVDFKALQDAPLLNGIINETLRLWPAILSGLQYLTPPEGITVGNTFIPGNVTVYSPGYTVQRCKIASSNFVAGL